MSGSSLSLERVQTNLSVYLAPPVPGQRREGTLQPRSHRQGAEKGLRSTCDASKVPTAREGVPGTNPESSLLP